LTATHPYFEQTLTSAWELAERMVVPDSASLGSVDPFVQKEIIKTNGNFFRHLEGRLQRYPVPEFRLEPRGGGHLLDIGCNWGRWTLAAARKGYRAIGLDPSLEACLAARRVAAQLGMNTAFVVGDARKLPFPDGMFDAVFSYSVLQHFDKSDARLALQEMGRCTVTSGVVLVQMPNTYGVRQAFNRLRQILKRESGQFRVRYWTPSELLRTFETLIGPSSISVDGYFSLNPQATDLDLLTPFHQRIVQASETLRRGSERFRPLVWIADSLYVRSVPGEANARPCIRAGTTPADPS
jgi:SAM-dependent methyltransferase